MPTIAPTSLVGKPSVFAALLLLVRDRLGPEEPFPRSTEEILRLTGSSRSQAYEMRSRLLERLDGLHQKTGRPCAKPLSHCTEPLTSAVLQFVVRNPGSVVDTGGRRQYSDPFRHFIVELAQSEQGRILSREQFSQATSIPMGTLADWLSFGAAAAQPSPVSASNPSVPQPGQCTLEQSTTHPRSSAQTASGAIATIANQWLHWRGGLSAFCLHLQKHWRIRAGRTFITNVLRALGLYTPKARKLPPPPWSRHSFRRFFPGAQWLGDGSALAIELGEQRFVFNLEAMVDVDTSAIVGVHVSDSENEAAVLATFEHGKLTTEAAPLGLTLDSKPSNHTSKVKEHIAPTRLIPATFGRGQAKAGVEGAFGLFSQTAPPLRIHGNTAREQARSTLGLIATVWAFAANGRPRKRLQGRSPAQQYQAASPSEEQLAEARAHLAELERRRQLQRRTREQRTEPVRLRLLRQGLERLQIPDPAGKVAISLAFYCDEAIIRGLAIYEAKAQNGSIPKDAAAHRYLGGIIRNLHHRLELEAQARALLELRLAHRELSLAPLESELERLRAATEPSALPHTLLSRALDTEARLDFEFFARATTHALSALPENVARLVLKSLVWRTCSAFSTSKARRQHLLAVLTKAFVERTVRPAVARS